ncbi:MAG TPA: hypothetical protein PK414_09495 [Anaerolineales bacterium]|nr:hypothetical protein [Anaerolineales bacterium]
MNRKTLTVIGIITAGLVVLSFVFLANTASDKENTFEEVLYPLDLPASPNAQIEAAMATPQEEIPTIAPENMFPPPTLIHEGNNDAEQLAKNAEVVNQVEALLKKSEFLSATSTWTHSSVKTDVFIAASDTMPDGSPMPMAYTTDNWYKLDENGYLIQAITMQDTGSPKTSQVSVLKDGIWTNLFPLFENEPNNFIETEPYRPADHTFLEQALLAKDWAKLDFGYSEFDGKRVAKYSIVTYNSIFGYGTTPTPPVKIYAYNYYLSLETGSVLMMEFFLPGDDGELHLVQRDTTIVEEIIKEPPAEILKYLE